MGTEMSAVTMVLVLLWAPWHGHTMVADATLAGYSPLPNIRPGPNYRLVGDEGSELIRDQDLFTNHLG